MRDLREATMELLMQGLAMEEVMADGHYDGDKMLMIFSIAKVCENFQFCWLLIKFWLPGKDDDTIGNTDEYNIGNTNGNISIQVATTLRLPQYEHWAMYDEWLR